MSSVIEKLEYAQSRCSEFFADVIIDPLRASIIVNIEEQYFLEIAKMLLSSGFYCVHITEFSTSITACFILIKL